jgi:hypothetical protein
VPANPAHRTASRDNYRFYRQHQLELHTHQI